MAGLFPFMDVPVKRQSGAALPVFREYAWDFSRDCLVLESGLPVVVERNEALKVWVYKVLNTPRFRYSAYTWSYGHGLEELVGSAYTNRVLQVEAERRVREAILVNPYITAVSVVTAELADSRLTIQVSMETVYGEVSMNV